MPAAFEWAGCLGTYEILGEEVLAERSDGHRLGGGREPGRRDRLVSKAVGQKSHRGRGAAK